MEKIRFLTAILLFPLAAPVFSQTRSISIDQDAAPYFIKPGSSFSASAGLNEPADPTVFERKKVVSDISEILGILRSQYAGKISAEELVRAAIDGSLRSLDPHSSYFDSKEFQEFMSDQESQYSGIGATISSYRKNGRFETYVLGTQPDSPAAKADLHFGDKIIAVNGTEINDLDSDTVRDFVRGESGSMVRLTIEKNLSGQIRDVNIRRRSLDQPSIPTFFILKDGVGYIGMTEGFTFTTSAELRFAVRELKRRGMTSLLLDLRGNPGGLLDQAVAVAEQFLPAGKLIVSQRGRKAFDNRTWRSKNVAPETMPVVLLVDRNTASASEVVAGALQDHDRALIVGEATFGKGLVQNVIDLPSGGALTLTGARYFTPSGRCIQRDYSSIGAYDYFNSRESVGKTSEGFAATKTDGNRIVFGGSGISPDDVLALRSNRTEQEQLIDAAFFFSREYIRNHNSELSQKVGFTDEAASAEAGKLLSDFERFMASGGIKLSDKQVADNSDFLVARIMYNLQIAAGAAHPERSLIAPDPVVMRGIEMVPKARELAAIPGNTKNSDVFARPLRPKTKQPARSHTGRAENRRN
jgi:carboxyl-terminal processing protease